MDEDITIIDNKTRNEKIKNFLKENKKALIFLFILLMVLPIGFYTYQMYKDKQREKISNKYNNVIIEHQTVNKLQITESLKDIIKEKDSTYSPLALYYIIDNNLVKDRSQINELFDILIDKTSLEAEIKNLIIYKKALFNADKSNEVELLKILNPLINSNSIWKSHAMYLIGEFFYNKGEFSLHILFF